MVIFLVLWRSNDSSLMRVGYVSDYAERIGGDSLVYYSHDCLCESFTSLPRDISCSSTKCVQIIYVRGLGDCYLEALSRNTHLAVLRAFQNNGKGLLFVLSSPAFYLITFLSFRKSPIPERVHCKKRNWAKFS